MSDDAVSGRTHRAGNGRPAAARTSPGAATRPAWTKPRPASAAGLTAIIGFVIASAIVSDRVIIGVATGGRGSLALLTFLAPAAAALAVVHYGMARTLAFARSPVFLLGVLPYLVLTLVLPFLGVLFNRYPERTLFSITQVSGAFSFLVLGATASAAPLRRWRPWLMAAVVLQVVYAAAQLNYLDRGPGWELFSPFHDWDLSLEAAYGTFVQARASGLYFNPNELGVWAAIAAVLAWAILNSRARLVGVTLAVLTLLLSQSRGATVALAAASAVAIAMAVLQRRVNLSGAARTVLSISVTVAVAIVVVVALQPSTGLADRFGALAEIWSQGPRADANLAGRLDYWAAVIDLNTIYPWGTLGPPEMLLGSAIDSTWFRVFAQGSVLYTGALALLLVSPFAVRRSEFRDVLIVLGVLIAVAGLTQTPLNYAVSHLFWTLLGAALQMTVTGPLSPASPKARRRGPEIAGQYLTPRVNEGRRRTAAISPDMEGSLSD